MTAIEQREQTTRGKAARRGWAARVAAWLCLVALVANQFLPPAIAILAERQVIAGDAFICHAGSIPDQPAPASDDDAKRHCPLCVVLAAPAFAPPAPSPLAAPIPVIMAIRVPPPLVSGLVATIGASPRKSRAPPSLA